MTESHPSVAVSAPPRKRLIIHSGTFKTGSTAIQLYLHRAEQAGVLREAGFHYPQKGRTTGVQHANLDTQLLGKGVYARRFGGWEDVVRDAVAGEAHTTIVSAEGLSTLQEEHLQRLAEIIRPTGLDVHWVHFVRDQPSLYNAFYVERVITMRPDTQDVIDLPFEEFGQWSPTDLGFLNHASFIARVRGALPEAEITIRPFARDYMTGGDSVQDFCHAVGLPYVAQHGGRANVGSGWRTVETARRLLPIIVRADHGSRVAGARNPRAIRQKWLQEIRGELVTAGTAAGWNRESAIYMTPAFREQLLATYHEENVRLDALVDFPWLEIVETHQAKPYNVGAFDDIAGEELLQVLARVLARVYEPSEDVKRMLANRRPAPQPAPPRTVTRRLASAARRRLPSFRKDR